MIRLEDQPGQEMEQSGFHGHQSKRDNSPEEMSDGNKETRLQAVRASGRRAVGAIRQPGTAVAREQSVRRNQLDKWQNELRKRDEDDAFRGADRNTAADQRSEVADLKKWLAQLEE